jgi:DNA-binding transcriptional LysR family regulator
MIALHWAQSRAGERDVDIKRLTHLIALAEEGRFAAAAERVHLSQAAFSRSIQVLEARMGLRLFDRTPRGVELTAAGQTVLQRARSLVFDSECLARDVALLKEGDAGEIVIGAAPVPAATLLPALLTRLRLERPKLVVRLRLGGFVQLVEQLEAQALDFCIGDPRLIPPNDRLAMVPLHRGYGSLCVRRGHPLAEGGAPGPEALRRYGIGAISMTRELLKPIANSLGFATVRSFPLALECDDIGLLKQVVTSTDLVGLLPEDAAQQDPGRLRQLAWKGSRVQFADMHALWLAGRTLSPAATRAIELAAGAGARP